MSVVPTYAISPSRPNTPVVKNAGEVAIARTPKMSEEQIKALQTIKEAQNNAKTALSGLQVSNQEARETKKQDALRRFDALNKRMMALKKAFGGDPKFLAKTLNAIAKELKSVVKDYKDAIGDKPSLTPNIQSIAANQAQLAEDQAANIEKTERQGEAIEAKPEIAEKQQIAEKETAIVASNKLQDSEEAAAKIAPLDAIRAYANSLMTDEHAKFMRGVRNMIDDIKHYSGLFKAQIKFASNDKEGERIINDGEEALKELFTETVNLQAKLNSPDMAVGNLVSMSA